MIFTAIDAVLLRTPGVADPHSIVRLYTGSTTDRRVLGSTSYLDYADLQASGVVDLRAVPCASIRSGRFARTERVVQSSP